VDLGRGKNVAPSQSITRGGSRSGFKLVRSQTRNRNARKQYRGHTRLHIVPLIGEIKLTDLTAESMILG
jgi:hypothetical protein